MVKINMRRENGRISIDEGSFEHILNCLANQKYVGKAPPCGDAMDTEPAEYRKVQKDNQEAIDDCWRQGMAFLSKIRNRKPPGPFRRLLCWVTGHVLINLDLDTHEADCERCGRRLETGYDMLYGEIFVTRVKEPSA